MRADVLAGVIALLGAVSACGSALESPIELPSGATVCVLDDDCVLVVDGCACEPGSLLAVRADAAARVEEEQDLRFCPALVTAPCDAQAVCRLGNCAVDAGP